MIHKSDYRMNLHSALVVVVVLPNSKLTFPPHCIMMMRKAHFDFAILKILGWFIHDIIQHYFQIVQYNDFDVDLNF